MKYMEEINNKYKGVVHMMDYDLQKYSFITIMRMLTNFGQTKLLKL